MALRSGRFAMIDDGLFSAACLGQQRLIWPWPSRRYGSARSECNFRRRVFAAGHRTG